MAGNNGSPLLLSSGVLKVFDGTHYYLAVFNPISDNPGLIRPYLANLNPTGLRDDAGGYAALLTQLGSIETSLAAGNALATGFALMYELQTSPFHSAGG